MASPLTAYADSNDGLLQSAAEGSSQAVWDSVRHATSASYILLNSTGVNVEVSVNDLGDGYWYTNINRYPWMSDTSSLPDDCTITAATFGFYIIWYYSGTVVTLVEGSQSSPPVADDFDAIGTTKLCSDFTIPGTGWRTISLNSSGLTAINKTGYTKLFMLEEPHDFDDVQSGYQSVQLSTAESANDPYLEITYTEAASGIPKHSDLYYRRRAA